MIRLVMFAFVFLTACATVSPSYTYRPANHSGPAWTISGKSEVGAFEDTVAITINGDVVASGTLNELTRPKDNFTGTYDGHNVLAECALVDKGGMTSAHECTVFVDNERVAQLSF